jgi:Leucine-rich repeat (LRR) protein
MDDDAGVKFLMQIVNQKTRRSNWGMATAKAEASTVASDKISDVATVVVAMAPAVDLPRQLGILDLSRNKLGVGFAETLPKFFAVCPLLHTLHLQYNQLGVQGGVLVAAALKGASALKYLDLSHNNLCGITPVFGSGEKREEWSGAAFTALSDAMLGGATINELLLHGNGACGLWPDRISGEQVLRGTYTSAAIDSLVHMLEQQQLPLKPPLPAAAGFRGFLGGLRLSDDNHMRKEEVRRLEKAKAENPTKPVNLDLSKTVASNKGGEQVKGVDLAEASSWTVSQSKGRRSRAPS